MKAITLRNKFQTNATLVANDFIDHYMVQANGEFVKVYLFLLRHINDPYSSLTISTIADCLNNTENDILRAFKYWEKKGLLRTECDSENKVCALELLEVTKRNEAVSSIVSTPVSNLKSNSIPQTVKAPSLSHSTDLLRAQKELKSLLFIAEQYLAKTLTKTDIDAITYFYDSLNMSADLIEYLIESCVEHGHKSIHYIQKVALSWADRGITTKEQAKKEAHIYNKNCYAVLNAFGIKNRGPAASEIKFIQKWTDEYGFTLDIIEEACSRTISATHQPSFEYADKILTKWFESQVRHLKDVTSLDTAFQKEKGNHSSAPPKAKPVSRNLNNFERRSYDMDSLEEQLLNSN